MYDILNPSLTEIEGTNDYDLTFECTVEENENIQFEIREPGKAIFMVVSDPGQTNPAVPVHKVIAKDPNEADLTVEVKKDGEVRGSTTLQWS